jgi:hypothetical protein
MPAVDSGRAPTRIRDPDAPLLMAARLALETRAEHPGCATHPRVPAAPSPRGFPLAPQQAPPATFLSDDPGITFQRDGHYRSSPHRAADKRTPRTRAIRPPNKGDWPLSRKRARASRHICICDAGTRSSRPKSRRGPAFLAASGGCGETPHPLYRPPFSACQAGKGGAPPSMAAHRPRPSWPGQLDRPGGR